LFRRRRAILSLSGIGSDKFVKKYLMRGLFLFSPCPSIPAAILSQEAKKNKVKVEAEIKQTTGLQASKLSSWQTKSKG
jgi:hypothetical protein